MGWLFLIFIVYFLTIWSERALVAATPADLEALGDENSLASQRALRLVGQIRPALAALLLLRLFLNIVAAVVAIAGLLHWPMLQTSLLRWSEQSGTALIGWRVATSVVAAIGLSAVFFGLNRAEVAFLSKISTVSWLKRLSGFIIFWSNVFRFFIRTEKADNSQVKTPQVPENPITDHAEESDEKREIELLKSIVRFADVTVGQVMQPREKVVGVARETRFHALLDIVREAGLSRLPVFRDSLDEVSGMLYVKDLLPHLHRPDDFRWQSLLRPRVLRVPATRHCSELLEEFKRQKMHLAIVTDDANKCVGVVTLEDILEEVTGDIRDEFDTENDPVTPEQ